MKTYLEVNEYYIVYQYLGAKDVCSIANSGGGRGYIIVGVSFWRELTFNSWDMSNNEKQNRIFKYGASK